MLLHIALRKIICNRNNIILSVFESKFVENVATAVVKAARESKAARMRSQFE